MINAKIYAKQLGEVVLHHTMFMIIFFVNSDSLWLNYAFPIVYLGETSTLFLNVRIIYRSLGKQEIWVSTCFALTFFLTRVVCFGLLIVQLFSQRTHLLLLLSLPLKISYFLLLPSAYCLNLYWFGKICRGIARVLSGKNDGFGTDGVSIEKDKDA
jgi:hypothetical protein